MGVDKNQTSEQRGQSMPTDAAGSKHPQQGDTAQKPAEQAGDKDKMPAQPEATVAK